MDSNSLSVINIVTTIVIGLIPIGIFIYQNHTANIKKLLDEKNAKKEILSVVAREIAQQNWKNISAARIESLIRSKARELNLNLTAESEFPILIQDLNASILGDHFLSSRLRSELIARVDHLEAEFKRIRPLLETLEFERLEVEPQIKWLRLIGRFLFYFFISTSLAMLTLMVSLYFTRTTLDVGYEIMPFIIGLMSATLPLIEDVRKYQTTKKEHEKAISSYEESGLETIRRVLKTSDRKATIKREYQVTMDDKRFIIDYVLESAAEKLPLEIKYKVQQSDIEAMVLSMHILRAKKGIIISYLKADMQTRQLAKSNNVAIFDRIISEADLAYILRNEGII